MKNNFNKMKGRVLTALLIAALVLSACGKTNSVDIIDEGADHFAEGKTEQDYSLRNSAMELSDLIDNYSGGINIPSGKPIPDSELPPEPSGGESLSNEVSNDDEYMRVLRAAFSNLDEDLMVSIGSGYDIDPVELPEYAMLIERADPLVISISNLTYSYSKNGDVVYYTFDYGIDKKTIAQMRVDTKKAVKQIVTDMDSEGKSDYEIVCMVNEYLCDNAEYSDGDDPYPPETYTAYGALVDGIAVCEGYSAGAKLLLNELGVVCDMEFGECTGGGGHAWNLVKVDGIWYQMDTTWNDACGNRMEYMLTTDSFMRASRTWDASKYPACTDTKYHK